MLTLYGDPASRTQRNLWMLNELGVPFELIPTAFLKGETQTPEFLALNPNGRVPVLVDDGLAIFESLAINLYLSRKYGGATAVEGIVEEALAIQWSLWVLTEVDKPLLLAAMNYKLFPPAERDTAEAAMAMKKLDRPFKVLDGLMKDRAFLLGDRFTVADINLASVMTLIPICGIPIHAYPAMAAWLNRCQQRPAAIAAWRHIDFTIPRPSEDELRIMFL